MVFRNLNCAVGAVLLFFSCGPLFAADESRLDELFERLRTPELAEWEVVQNDIISEWSRSGSDAMDLLLKRGRDALEEGDFDAAIEHFTALTDHAPEFAEGYNMRATAFFMAEMFGPSLADIETTLRLNPRHFGALAGLGTIFMELGQEKKALKAYRMSLEWNPHQDELRELVDRLGSQFDGKDI